MTEIQEYFPYTYTRDKFQTTNEKKKLSELSNKFFICFNNNIFYFILQIWKITNIIVLKIIFIHKFDERTTEFKKILKFLKF